MTSHPKVGVGRALVGLLDHKARHLLWPEGLPAVIVGAGGAWLLTRATSLQQRVEVMGDLVQIAAAMLAIAFTALAIIVALPAGRYLRALQEDRPDGDGMRVFLDPFLVAVGVQVALLLSVISFGLAASVVSPTVERIWFCAIGFLLVYGLLDVVALARSLVRHGINRAVDAVREHDTDDARVAKLPDRRQG